MKFRSTFLVGLLLLLLPTSLSAQGIFQGVGTPRTIVSTGYAELIAPIHINLTSGTTMADTLVVDVSPMVISNASTTDIRVVTSGSVTVGALVLEASEGRLQIPLNAGGASGSMRVEGIRVSAPGTGATSVTARLSWQGNRNLFRDPVSGALGPSSAVQVVNRIQSGLVADSMTDLFVIFNGRIYDDTATVVVREGFSSAFSNSADFGQNSPVQVRIRVTDIPGGLTLRFPATVTAEETGSTLTTVEGGPALLPRPSGSTTVVYNFSGVVDSDSFLESFKIPFTVGLTELTGIVQPTIEVSLSPFGSLTESTAVPRFAEDYVTVLEGSSRIVARTFYWTGINASRENRVTLFNTSTRTANLIFTALDASGRIAGSTTQVRQSLSTNQSSDQSLNQIFGTEVANVATVRIQSTVSDLLASGTSITAGVTESIPLAVQGTSSFTIPILRESVEVHILNPGSTPASGTLRLLDGSGGLVGAADITLEPLASLSRSITDLFGVQEQGQVVGLFGSPVVAFETLVGARELGFIQVRPTPGVESLYVPFVSIGSGYDTDINLVNSSDQNITLTAQLFDGQGARVQNTLLISLAPLDQLVTTAGQLFGVQNLATGYVRFQAPQLNRGFWTYYPQITGYARIRSTQGDSTLLPLAAYTQQEVFLLDSGGAAGGFQGIALVNSGSTAVNVTLQAMSSTGSIIASAVVPVPPRQLSAKLTSEYFSSGLPPLSVIRVTSSAPIIVTSISGNTDGSLRSIPPLR